MAGRGDIVSYEERSLALKWSPHLQRRELGFWGFDDEESEVGLWALGLGAGGWLLLLKSGVTTGSSRCNKNTVD